jgi:hypothetical protein
MKTINYLLIPAIALMTITSCKSKKATVTVKETGFKKVESPLTEKQYKSDEQNFRARGIGESPDESAARKIALMNAKSEMAGLIKTTMQKVSDQYTNQRSSGKDKEYENKFEELIREVTNLDMANLKEMAAENYVNDQGTNKTYVVLEVKKEEIFKKVESKITSDKKLQLDYDKQKFQQIFDSEMKKLGEEGK